WIRAEEKAAPNCRRRTERRRHRSARRRDMPRFPDAASTKMTSPTALCGKLRHAELMREPVVGNPLWAVLIPPRLARFRTLVEVGDAPLMVDFTGWNKYVILGDDRAFLFPRQADNVEWFERELTA